MSQHFDDLWQRILDDARPRAKDLAAAERHLAQIHPGSLATSEPYLARVMIRPIRRRRSLLATAAGVLLMLGGLGSAAWISSPLIWPTAELLAELPDDYGAALQAAGDEQTAPARMRQVLGRLDERCAMLIRELGQHVQADPAVTTHGAKLAAELLAALEQGSAAAASVSEEQFAAAVLASQAALPAEAAAGDRTRIMDRLRDAALPGLAAVHALEAVGIQVDGGLDPKARLRDALGSMLAAH